MDFLNNKNTRLVLVVVTVVGSLALINMNQKKLGKQVSLLSSVATLLVGVVSFNMVLNQQSNTAEGFYDEHEENNSVVENQPEPAEANTESSNEPVVENEEVSPVDVTSPASNPVPTELEVGPYNMSNSCPQPLDASDNMAPIAGCLPREVLNPQDLLPSANSPNTWDTPANPGGIEGPNFLNPEHLVGINTVGQSLRNANRQLRSEPANPQIKVSPWLQSTIEPDTNRRPLEIGGC